MLTGKNDAWRSRMRTAKRAVSILPVVVFILTLMLLAGPLEPTPYELLQLLIQATLAALASCFVCIAAYGFYRYLSDRSPGL